MESKMKEKLQDACLELNIRIEFSCKDAHRKGNLKCKVNYVESKCEGCAHCLHEACPHIEKIKKTIADIQRELG